MSNIASIEGVLPGFSKDISVVSYSGCCAIFLNGSLIGNGALLWSGKHIITAARVVNGLTPSSNLTFQFDTSASYSTPSIVSITVHPSYSTSGGTYNHNIAIIEFSTTFSNDLERYRIEQVPAATMRPVVRRTYGRTLDPVTGADVVDANTNTSVIGWKSIDDIYEAYGIYYQFSSYSSYPITVGSQLVSDYDDGTQTRNTVNRKMYSYGVGASTFTQTNNVGFVTVDNYGAPAFIGSNLAGIVGNILTESPPTYSITSTPGTYGTVAYDSYVAYYAGYIQSVVGSTSLYPELIATSALSPGALLSSPSPMTNPYPKYNAAIGTYVMLSGTSSSSLILSNDYGKTWTTYTMPFTYSPPSSYGYFHNIAKYGDRIVVTGSRKIFTSDDNYVTWVERFESTSSGTGPVTDTLRRHPYSGIWIVGGFGGRLYTSTDNAVTWTETQLVTTYSVYTLLHESSATFIAYNTFGIFTSTTGATWTRRADGVNTIYAVGNGYFTDAFTASVDGGATWFSLTSVLPCYLAGTTRIDFYNLAGKYFAFRHTSGDGIYTAISDNGVSWEPIKDLERWNATIGSLKIASAALGNGLILLLVGSGGAYYLSEDSGLTWKSYDFIAGNLNRVVYKVTYSEPLGMWFACGYGGFFAYSKDPRCSWRVETLYDSYGSLATINGAFITPQSVVPYGSYDTWYIPAIATSTTQPEPVYATKITPIANSGLLGIVAGSTHFSGTLLQTGKDILTSAHAVIGITDYSSVQIIFNVDAAITIPAPTVIGITSHPSYSATPNTSGWINYDLAIIHLQAPVDARVSRYELYSGDEAMPVVFNKTGYGHAWDPVSGVAEVDNLHFIAFQNRYESLGLPLQGLGISYIASDLHLLYDYDDGTSTHDAIGGSSGFINQPSNTGLGANEGFTAPGRSGSAGLLGGKIAGVTFGTYSIPGGFDINGTSSDATYGEVGIDMRISMFSSWIGDIADFGVDVEGSLPGFSSNSELWFTQPTGLVVEGSLSGLTASLVAAQPDQFGIDQLLPGLSPDIIVTVPWQMEATVFGLTSDISFEKAPAIAVDGELLAFTSSFDITAVGAFDWEARLPALVPDQQLELAALFTAQSTLSLLGGIVLQPAYDVSLSGILPVLVSDFLVKSDFEVVALLPSLTSELDLIYRSIEFTARLPELTSDMSLEGYTFNVDSKLLALQGDFQWAHNEMAIDATMPALLGGMKFHATSDVVFEATLPDLTFEGLWQGMELADVMPGLRGGMKVIDANSCTTRYL